MTIREVRGRVRRTNNVLSAALAARGAIVTAAASTVGCAVRQALEDGVCGAVGAFASGDDRGAGPALRYLRKERQARAANSCPGRRLGLPSRLRRPRSAIRLKPGPEAVRGPPQG